MLKACSIRCFGPTPSRSSGFTLVEMLVAVALVLLMMSMFAGVFVEATTTLSKQRGIAENDQRGRLLTMTIRGDLDERTFRDVLPFRANEDTRQLGHSLARRAGYFEIDEGNPSDDTDDVLSFTASVNIRLQSKDASPFVGNATALSAVGTKGGIGANSLGVLVTASTSSGVTTFTFSDNGYFLNKIGSRVWLAGSPCTPYTVNSFGPVSNTNPNTSVIATPPSSASSASGSVNLFLAENEPEFDDGTFGNSIEVSALAEICYFLRNGILYRRVLLIRDTPAGTDAQPTYGTGVPVLWNSYWSNYTQSEQYYPCVIPATNPPTPVSTFWRDFDSSAFYYTGYAPNVPGSTTSQGVRFHNAAESLSNSNQGSQVLYNNLGNMTPPFSTLPFSLGIPHYRFGHSIFNGLPQDASTVATINGNQVLIGRYNLQECSNISFGYPGNLSNGNPFDSQNIVIDPATGLVAAFESQYVRRGQDILLSNVLSFDVKVWDAYNGNNQFVDIGNSTATLGPFSSNAGVITDTGLTTGNVVGGRLNSTYGPDISQSSLSHFRFDTWHPNASISTAATNLTTPPNYPSTPVAYNEPPYYPNGPTTAPYIYNEPPYVPVVISPATGLNQTAPLTAIQITINYRDVSSDQVRQVTIVQSLVDRVKQTSVTNESPEE